MKLQTKNRRNRNPFINKGTITALIKLHSTIRVGK